MHFLNKLLPESGYVCVAQALTKGFRHHFYEDRQAAADQIEALDAQGHTVYLAQASFRTEDNRKHENALALKAFFLDIDCGEGKDYPDQKTAAAALTAMVTETGLPVPAVVISGNGLYAYWFIVEEIPAQQWQSVARLLKTTLAAYGFRADPARTSDMSSVLRPPGATHRKDPNNPKKVRLVRDADPVPFMDFVRPLHKAAKKKQLNLQAVTPPKPKKDLNADFYEGISEGPPSSAYKVAEKCTQIAYVCAQKGDVSEPVWYAAIGVLCFTEEADDIIHEWSSGHPDYTAKATQEKTEQWRDSGTGPTTCSHFGSINPQGCVGCRHANKITSPIQLGRPEPKAIETPVEEVETPEGFRRADGGLHYEEDGLWIKFYDHDLYPVQLAYDESLGYEVVTIRHHLPHEGWLEFVIRTSLVNDPKGFMTAFYDSHVKVVGLKEKKVMVAYVESYMQKLQRNRRMAMLMSQMGWKNAHDGSTIFVLGKKIFRADGAVEDAQLARNVPSAAKGFRSEGDLAKWVEGTRILDRPGMEPFAFALLCGFGAPLMKFTGFEGAMVSMVGSSGAGKTLLLRKAMSIYGNHSELILMHKDTQNALVSRLGVYGTLPLAIDEVTNISAPDLSDLAYRVTQGRDKVRLDKNSIERKNINSWNTIALVSTNASLIDRLQGHKHDASAEVNRVFEYPVAFRKDFSGETTTAMYWNMSDNYGKAGEVYIQWLVKNVDKLRAGLDMVRAKIDKQAGIRGDERYWSAIAATALYGGAIAKGLGLIDFSLVTMTEWVVQTINNMREQKDELADTAVGILGQFIDEHSANRLIVKNTANGGVIPIEMPRGPLYIRHESDSFKVFISRAQIKTWLGNRFGEYSKLARELKELGALRHTGQRKTLSAGTVLGGAQIPCWVINLKCPALGAVGLQLVQDAENMETLKEMEESHG